MASSLHQEGSTLQRLSGSELNTRASHDRKAALIARRLIIVVVEAAPEIELGAVIVKVLNHLESITPAVRPGSDEVVAGIDVR